MAADYRFALRFIAEKGLSAELAETLDEVERIESGAQAQREPEEDGLAP